MSNILNSPPPSNIQATSIQRPVSPFHKSPIVDKTLEIYMYAKKSRECLKWGSVNIVLLSIVLFDVSNRCPYANSRWYYVEYIAASLLGLSALYYFTRYFYYLFCVEPVKGSEEQRKLLKFDINDASFITTPVAKKEASKNLNMTPMNVSGLSWHNSFNDSNLSTGSPGWIYSKGSPPKPANYSINNSLQNASPNNSGAFSLTTRKYTNKNNLIVDEKSLQSYLKEVSMEEKNQSASEGFNLSGNSFSAMNWNSYKMDDMANLLKLSQYQLSPSAVPPNKQIQRDESNLYHTSMAKDVDVSSDLLKKVSSVQLSTYMTNLKKWISLTIFQRIVEEIETTDNTFKTKGFSDIQIGAIGLERLKKTAENQLITMHVPRLPMLVPFLDISSNQEYVVRRIRDLAKGSCLTEYTWNGGSTYKGLNWDEHLPTDAAVVFHLFCTYMDSQLRPLPQGGRSFYDRYVIIGDKKTIKETITEVKNKAKCAILCTNPLKPKFNFISDGKIHNAAGQDRNNLFYVIIQFLIYMKQHQESSLEGINLGPSGFNIQCVIEDS